MRRLATVRNTLRSLFQRRQVEADLELELRQHLEQEIESNIGAGMSPDQARLAALRLIGPMPLHREECREWRGTALIETCARDVRYALQMFRRTPLFTAAAVLTLTLGIGANTAVFTFVENMLLRPLPVRDPRELAFLSWGGMVNIAYPNYADLRDQNQVFSGLMAYRYNPLSIERVIGFGAMRRPGIISRRWVFNRCWAGFFRRMKTANRGRIRWWWSAIAFGGRVWRPTRT